ncbi:MAG: SdrD B-like domain-containing protein [Planctomycetota bacterium]
MLAELLETRRVLAAISVTRFDDPVPDACLPTDCSLREAVMKANADSGSDTIQLGPGTYTLSIGNNESNDSGADGGDLDVTEIDAVTEVVGVGMGATIIDVDASTMSNRIFDVQGNLGFRLNSLTLQDGNAIGGSGGAIRSIDATLELDEVAFANNHAAQLGGALFHASPNSGSSVAIHDSLFETNESISGGGAVFLQSPTQFFAAHLITKSTFTENRAGGTTTPTVAHGGAIQMAGSSQQLAMENVTLSGNIADGKDISQGGAIYNDFGVLQVSHSTIVGNSARTSGGGITDLGNGTLLSNSIVGGNFNSTTLQPDDIDPAGAVATCCSDFNVIGMGGSGGLADGVDGNQVGVDATKVVEPLLSDNGGMTPTHLPLANGPAIDAGAATTVFGTVTLDQRGNPRPIDLPITNATGGDGTDVGAVELQTLPMDSGISGFVWEDFDANGIQDPGEFGIDGVEVRLLDTTEVVLETTHTSDSGYYGFASLAAGDYLVEFIPPPAFGFSPPEATPNTEWDSDADQASGRTKPISLAPASSIVDLDAGLSVPTDLATIGDLVWSDLNGNGIKEPGEPGIEGVTVNLFNSNGAKLHDITTDAQGRYWFSGLAAGSYTVEVEEPFGFAYSFSPVDQGQFDERDSDFATSDGRAMITLEAGEVFDTLFAGLVADPASGSIGDRVWEDIDGDGIQDWDEPGMPGVRVTLSDGGKQIALQKTDRSGSYRFNGLPAGNYTLQFSPPLGHVFSPRDIGSDENVDSDVEPLNGTVTVALLAEEEKLDVDAGVVAEMNSAVISGHTFQDDDGDGLRDVGDGPLAGVNVKLLDALGSSLLASTVSDSLGNYRFGGLAAGDYVIEFGRNVRGYERSPQDQGDDRLDSDPDAISGRVSVALSVGQSNNTVDAGFVDANLATISGRAWTDWNDSGLQDRSSGRAGITVTLFDSTGTRILGRQTTSSEEGRVGGYRFSGLAAGSYRIHFGDNIAGRSYTAQNVGTNDLVDSDVDPITGEAIVSLGVGEYQLGVDAGYVIDKVGTSVIRGRIWNDLNGDGIQGDSEPSLDEAEGRTVFLRGGLFSGIAFNSIVRDGEFEFRGIPGGTYTIELPYIRLFRSPPDVGSDLFDSDAIEFNRIRLTVGDDEIKDDVAAGFFHPNTASISGRLWEDLDGDGIQDPSEPGFPTGVVTASLDGRRVRSARVVDGLYRLPGLPAGHYSIEFRAFGSYDASPRDQGSDDALDSEIHASGVGYARVSMGEEIEDFDAGLVESSGGVIYGRVWDDLDGDGFQDPGEPNLPSTVRLFNEEDGAVELHTASGFYRFGGLSEGTYYVIFPRPTGYKYSPQNYGGPLDSDPDPFGWAVTPIVSGSLVEIDAGLFQDLPGTISGRVWDDLNANGIQDVGEPGLSGVPVQIKDLSGRVLGTTVSSERIVPHLEPGVYRFGGLAAGTYIVTFGPSFDGYSFAPNDEGDDDAIDSDPIGRRVVVAVGNGESKDDVDAGLFENQTSNISGRVWEDRNGDGVQDPDETGLEGIAVQIFDGTRVRRAYTVGDDGQYSIRGLRPGTYTLQFVGPTGSVASPANQSDDDRDSDPINNRVTVTLSAGENADNIDAGFVEESSTAVILGRLWNDLNGDGIQDANEENFEGRTVVFLEDESGRRTLAYPDDGSYSFRGLAAGTYTVGTNLGIFGSEASDADAGNSDLLDSDFVDGRAVVTVGTGELIDDVDAGFVESTFGFLSGRVWNDEDTDGIEDPGEPGIGGVTVELRDLGGRTLAIKTSGATDGEYRFGGLEPGIYMVVFGDGPTGFTRSAPDQGGDDRVDSDPIGRRVIVNVPTGGSVTDVDAGMYENSGGAVIWGRVWNDLNQDGIQDPGEPDWVPRSIFLVKDGRLARNIEDRFLRTSGARFRFAGLEPGEYFMKMFLQAGVAHSDLNVGTNDEIDSDFIYHTPITVTEGQIVSHFDAGVYEQLDGVIRGRVWDDRNANGVQEPDELGLDGISVELRDDSGRTIASTVSGGAPGSAPGTYRFGGLPEIPSVTYTLVFGAPPTGYIPSIADATPNELIDNDVINRRSTVRFGDVIDAGYHEDTENRTGVIHGRVFTDSNGNGILDPLEPGGPDVTVQLRDHSGRIIGVSPTFTRHPVTQRPISDTYRFGGLSPGDYTVMFADADGYLFSPVDQGTDDTVDSDVDPVTGNLSVTLANDEVLSVDAGYIESASAMISGFVWLDPSATGIRRVSGSIPSLHEPLLNPGQVIDVRLFDESGRLIRETRSQESLESPLPLPAFARRSIQGPYSFAGLAAGTYTVEFSSPTGHLFSPADATNDVFDSDVNGLGRFQVTLTAGEHREFVDAGLVPFSGSSSIEGRIWYDVNGDGSRESEFHRGFGDVIVRLYDNETSFLVGQTSTSDRYSHVRGIRRPAGTFFFHGLPAGSYRIETERPGGFQFSTQDAVSDLLDSDADDLGQVIVSLGASEVFSTVGVGLVRSTASIGDLVWEDRNGNGIRDAGEPGIVDVPVALYDETGTYLIKTTRTEVGGHYSFGLDEGDDNYVVQFVPPIGFAFTNQIQGTNPLIDSDADPATGRASLSLGFDATDNSIDAGLVRVTGPMVGTISDRVWNDLNGDGIQDVGEPGLSDIVVRLWDEDRVHLLGQTSTTIEGNFSFQGLPAAAYSLEFVPPRGYEFSPTNQGNDDAFDSDAEVIAGFVDVLVVAGIRNTDVDVGMMPIDDAGELSGLVWNDENRDGIRDANELGLDQVTVLLYDGSEAHLLDAMTTRDGGQYNFAGLSAGDYVIEFLRPAGFEPSPNDQGNDDALDSDANAVSGRTERLTLIAGEMNDTVGAGFVSIVNGNTSSIGNRVWKDLNADGIQDVGEPGIPGVRVRLLDATASLILNELVTSATGEYEFLGLDEGDYVVEVHPPLSFTHSPRLQGTDQSVDSDGAVTTGRSAVIEIAEDDMLDDIDFGLVEQFPTAVIVTGDFAGVLPDDDPDGAGPLTQFGRDTYATIPDAIVGLDAFPNETPVQLMDEPYAGFAYDRPNRRLRLTPLGTESTVESMTVTGGILIVDGRLQVPFGVNINAGGILGGTGEIDGDILIASGGTLSPGFSPGLLRTGGLTLAMDAIFRVEIDGTVPGMDHDQVIVDGQVHLTDAVLDLHLGYAPSVGEQIVLIDNDESDAVIGTFAGLDEGDSIYLGASLVAVVTYAGGTGNDVVLSIENAETIAPVLLSFTRTAPNENTNADTLGFHATFSEDVAQIDVEDFAVSGASTANIESVMPVAGTGEVIYLITVSGGDLPLFNGSLGIDLSASVDIVDTVENPLADTEPGIDETYLVDHVPPRLSDLVIADGSAQRSMIESISLNFDSPVVLSEGAIDLMTANGEAVAFSSSNAPGVATQQVVLSFPSFVGGSLVDGDYLLRLDEALIVDAAGNAFDGDNDGEAGGARATDEFFRFFGDTDGDRDVDGQDYGRFGATFLLSDSDPGFDARFDHDSDGDIDGQDFGQFAQRFLSALGN